jgi:hypothetical protein
MSRRKLTVDFNALLAREVELRAQMHTYRELARITGCSEGYIARVMSRLLRAKGQLVDGSFASAKCEDARL